MTHFDPFIPVFALHSCRAVIGVIKLIEASNNPDLVIELVNVRGIYYMTHFDPFIPFTCLRFKQLQGSPRCN